MNVRSFVLEEIIPHKPPFVMVSRLEEVGEGTGVITARIGADHLLVEEDGTLDPCACVEILAQAFAALKGAEARLEGGGLKKGFLVGVKSMEVFGQARIGELLVVLVRVTDTFGPFEMGEGEIFRDGELLARGSIKVWTPKEESA